MSMPIRSRNGLAIAVLWALGCLVADVATAQVERAASAGPLVVELAGGRCFAGDVDRRTDGDTLWLRRDIASGYVTRPIDWARVVRVALDGDDFSGEEFHNAVVAVAESLPVGSSAAAGLSSSGTGFQVREAHGQDGRATLPEVRSLAVEAWLANWDADVEPDGLVLEIHPLDAYGCSTFAFGGLEASLVAERTGVVKLDDPFRPIGRWTQPVRPTDFGPSGARYRLPFQAIHPDFDLRWASHGALNVRLSVPGSGVFEATESTLRIRPASGVRDRLEQASGRRYFSFER